MSPRLKLVLRLLFIVAIGGAAILIYRGLTRYSGAEIAAAIGAIPAARVVGAFAFAAASYLCLTGFDWLAVRYAGKALAWRRTALASFVSLSIGHNIGVAALSSGAIRYRFYTRWGLDGGDVAKVIIFCGITVGIGLTTMGGVGLIFYPDRAEGLLGLRGSALQVLALLCLAAPATYLALSAFLRKQLRFRHWSLELPGLSLAFGQVVIGTLNFGCVAACLYHLLAAFSAVPYLEVVAIYIIGNVAGLVSHVPGGLGVLEATVHYLLPGAKAVGALIAFRVIYYFVPLAIGLPLLLASEFSFRGNGSKDTAPQSR